MGNAATASYSYGAQILHYIQDVNISDEGGQATPIRTITPSMTAVGWRLSQKPTYQITFSVPIMDDGAEVDWLALKESKDLFTFVEDSDNWTRSFNSCVVQACDSATDTDTQSPTWSVTIGALSSSYEA
jgi:hypothetical protein